MNFVAIEWIECKVYSFLWKTLNCIKLHSSYFFTLWEKPFENTIYITYKKPWKKLEKENSELDIAMIWTRDFGFKRTWEFSCQINVSASNYRTVWYGNVFVAAAARIAQLWMHSKMQRDVLSQ